MEWSGIISAVGAVLACLTGIASLVTFTRNSKKGTSQEAEEKTEQKALLLQIKKSSEKNEEKLSEILKNQSQIEVNVGKLETEIKNIERRVDNLEQRKVG